MIEFTKNTVEETYVKGKEIVLSPNHDSDEH